MGKKRVLQLVLGPAGSGKSFHLRQEFAAALRRRERALLLVPTVTYREHTRNQVLRENNLPGLEPTSVATFNDLLKQFGVTSAECSGARRELIVRRLLRDLDPAAFRTVREFPGFRAALADAADEVVQAGISPQQLLQALPPSAAHRDFTRFVQQYAAALERAGFDPLRISKEAAKAIRQGSRFTLLALDGFADFTPVQRELLAALASVSDSIRVALTLDRSSRDMFYQAERSRKWLGSIVPGEPKELWLEENRRSVAATLTTLEQALRGGASEIAPLLARDGALQTIAAADRQDEAELIAREALRLARAGTAFSDIAIIVRNPARYAELFRGVFRRAGVPLRVFTSTPLTATGAGRHLKPLLDLLVPGNMPEALLAWLKSPYSTVKNRRVTENFEYRALARLADARAERWELFERHDSEIAAILEKVRLHRETVAAATGPRQMGRAILAAWRDLTHLLEIPERATAEQVLEWRSEAGALRGVEALIEEITVAAEAERALLAFEDFRELLLHLVGATGVRTRDRRQDAVTLMGPFEARQWEQKAVFVAGLVEREFPAAAHESLVLDDEARRRLAETPGIALPTTADRSLDERLLFYIAATRARDRLYLCWPQADAAGAPLLRSFFLRALQPLLKHCPHLERKRSDGAVPLEYAAAPADLLGYAHLHLASRNVDNAARQRAAAIHDRLRATGITSRAAAALATKSSRLTVPAALDALRLRATHFSASAFSLFTSCAYKHFAAQVLKLTGPAIADRIDPLREGKVAHDTIARWETEGRARAIGEVLAECFAEATDTIPPGYRGAKSRAEMAACLERFAERELLHDSIYRTSPDPSLVELRFGGESGRPPLKLTVAGETLTVHGRIDRLEKLAAAGRELALVVDYKYSAGAFSEKKLEDMDNGRELQLMIYLLAAEEVLGLVPAGAELYPLKKVDAGRCGLYSEEHAVRLFHGSAPGDAAVLPAVEFRRRMQAARAWLERLAADIRAGAIDVLPDKKEYCSSCDYYDLCRVKPWALQPRKLEAAQ